jgi:anion-transporting  ArsA/GET3 family ATPase
MDTAPTGHTLLLLDTTGVNITRYEKTTKLDPATNHSLQNPELAKILLWNYQKRARKRNVIEWVTV